MWRSLAVLSLLVFAPIAHAAVPLDVVRGTVASTSPCGAQQLVWFVERTAPLIIGTSTTWYGPGRGPTPGTVVFAVVESTTTCATTQVRGRYATHIVYGALEGSEGGSGGEGSHGGGGSEPGSGSGGGAGEEPGTGPGSETYPGSEGRRSDPLSNRLGDIARQAQSFLQRLVRPPPPPMPSLSVPAGIPFGGPITSMIFCDNGAIYTILGPPTPGPYVWMPGTISFRYGPPSFVGQFLLGASTPPPTGVCLRWPTILYGSLIIMHGSSGPTIPGGPSQPAEGAEDAEDEEQPTCSSGTISTAPQKAAAERQVRGQLTACGVSVNRTVSCGLGQSFRAYQNIHCPRTRSCGCTDVSGLSCDAIRYICELAQTTCRGSRLTISGGSEGGHQTHGTGNAFDIVGIDSCVRNNFRLTDPDECIYTDPRTGSTFRDETNCRVSGTTGPHFHVCVPGTGCR